MRSLYNVYFDNVYHSSQWADTEQEAIQKARGDEEDNMEWTAEESQALHGGSYITPFI